jgi:hypothetical protein
VEQRNEVNKYRVLQKISGQVGYEKQNKNVWRSLSHNNCTVTNVINRHNNFIYENGFRS